MLLNAIGCGFLLWETSCYCFSRHERYRYMFNNLHIMGETNETVIKLLKGIIDSLEQGNSNVDEKGMALITKAIQEATNQTQKMSTAEAIKYLNIPRSKFYIMKDLHLIKGEKGRFQRTVYYTKKELDELIIKMKEKNGRSK